MIVRAAYDFQPEDLKEYSLWLQQKEVVLFQKLKEWAEKNIKELSRMQPEKLRQVIRDMTGDSIIVWSHHYIVCSTEWKARKLVEVLSFIYKYTKHAPYYRLIGASHDVLFATDYSKERRS